MHRLERLLRPQSIAAIGGKEAAAVIAQCDKMGFAGAIWPVHPTRSEIGGRRAYASIADLPGAPDAAFVGVNRFATIDIVRALKEKGTGGAVAYASGFLEAGADDADGARLQAELVEAAGDMPLVGPNCYGLINYLDGALMWPDQHGGRRLSPDETGVAIVTQSSNIAINMTMQRRGLPVAYVMTAGNQAQTGLSEIAMGLIEDERVTALGLHIEGFDSIAGFERLAARARKLGKPVVAMKVGRSAEARAATVSHTASLSGSDTASDAFLKRLGIGRATNIPAFLETLKLLHCGGPLPGFGLSSMSCSGGEASVMADSVVGSRMRFPTLEEAHRVRVKATLGPLVAVANPLDYHTFIWNDGPAMTATFSAMVSGGFDLNCLVLDFPRTDRCSDADWWTTVDAFESALRANDARGAIVASMPENMPEDYATALVSRGIAPMQGIAEMVEAAETGAMIGAAWARPAPGPLAMPASAGGGTPTVLDEAAAKERLRAFGLAVPEGRRASNADEAAAAAAAIGYPVAMKVLGLAHKSEKGAVRLGLADEAGVRQAAAALSALGSGLYVEAMVKDAVAELIVGVTRDPLFGPVMTIGTGGVLVELLGDSALLLLPASAEEVEAAFRGLRLFPLLDGYRGRTRADLGAVVAAVLAIQRFAIENAGSIAELDINPLIVCRDGAFAADALLVVEEETCPTS
jgi:acetate---CoA ligase (ADP-forming)